MRSRQHAVLLLLSLLVLCATACSARQTSTQGERDPAEPTNQDANVEDGASEPQPPAPQSLDAAIAERDAPLDASGPSAQDAASARDASTRDGSSVSTDATIGHDAAAPDSVGRGCLPDRVPVDKNGWRGFLGTHAYVEPSVHCGDDPCLVYHVDNGVPNAPVDLTVVCNEVNSRPWCTPRHALHNSVYCSCRCDDPRCQCDPDFVCKPIVVHGQRELQPYCVWKHASWVENPDVLEDDVPDSGLPPPRALDLLVVIDNSAAMAEEQKKLFELLDDFVAILATGNRNGQPTHPDLKPDFPAMESMHLGVISADLGLNGAPAYDGCGELAFAADERDRTTATQRVPKPLGDDGLMQTSMAVAISGMYVRSAGSLQSVLLVPPDPSCATLGVPGSSSAFTQGERFVRFRSGVDNPAVAALALGCVARLGRNGCDRTQPLEAALKALTPPDSAIQFTRDSAGHGTALAATGGSGANGGFLRDDALLVVLFLSDGDDCSIPDASNALFDPTSAVSGQSRVRCGLPANQSLLHDLSRYTEGLRALKSAAYRDRIIVGAIAGMPQADSSSLRVRTGRTAVGALLAEEAMQFRVAHDAVTSADEPAPVCTNIAGHGSASPSRRLISLAREFGNNAFVGSVCELTYADLLNSIVGRIITRWYRP